MTTSSHDLARAAIAALTEALQKSGHAASPTEVLRLITQAAEDGTGTITLTVASPTGDADALLPALTAAVEKKTGKKVSIRQKKDPSLIGGILVSYGDERIDFSVKRSLEDAELLFSQNS